MLQSPACCILSVAATCLCCLPRLLLPAACLLVRPGGICLLFGIYLFARPASLYPFCPAAYCLPLHPLPALECCILLLSCL